MPLLAGTGPATAAPGDDPLAVTVESMTPSVVPSRGTLTLSGEVTNTSEETWTDLQVYLLTSATPLTTSAELDDAVASDPATEVASRLTTEGLFDEIGDLEPGESTSYTVSVPRRSLEISGEPGVYWTGVQVLGASDGGRDGFADGRARTFVPLLGPRARPTDVALVVGLRDRVRRSADGRLLGLPRWQRSLSSDGRLGRLVDFVAEGEGALTWVVDPAVLDAASSVARDNPPLATGDDGSGPTEDGGEESPSPSPTGEPAPEDPEATDGETMVEASEEAVTAAAWLEDFVGTASRATVMALPYGDVDVAAVTVNRLARILRTARGLSKRTLDGLGLSSDPVVAPANGLLPPRSLARLSPELPVLLGDRALPDVEGPVAQRPGGTEVVLLHGGTGAGGPGPNRRRDPLALRQRILAEAAVRSLEGPADEPLVVALPPGYDPGPEWQAADFFDGLEVPWLRQVDLSLVLASDSGVPSDEPPVYPPGARSRHIPFSNQLATVELRDTGKVYADLLTDNDTVADELAKAAMLASSYSARSRPDPALGRARNTTLRVRRTMQLVDIDGPPFVMMSSETGPIAVTVVNNLDEPVTVRLEARTPRDDLRISVPDPVTLEPGQRAPVRMRAESNAIGVHEVTLIATTESGEPLGSEVQFNVRTSNVGYVIWLVMGIGGGVLLVMIVFRVVRRVRVRRTEPETAPESLEPESTA